MSQFYIENDKNQFFELGVFFSSTMEMNGSKQYPIVPFTLSTRIKDLVLTLVMFYTTLLTASKTKSSCLNYLLSTQISLWGKKEKCLQIILNFSKTYGISFNVKNWSDKIEENLTERQYERDLLKQKTIKKSKIQTGEEQDNA